jgi:transposase
MPLGLVTDHVEIGPDKITATARSSSTTAACPTCNNISAQVHSRYQRCLADVPVHGRLVEIRLQVRRFRCRQRQCSTKIFGERLCEGITRPFGRRTSRLENLARHLGLALGGRPGQSLARRLLLPLSKDALLRFVRRHAAKAPCSRNVVGVDDWAWKRGHRYRTIICDLGQRRVIDLLPDREMATVRAWLADRPSIRIISRDRGGGYGQAATRGRPEAIQVADRWHLVENASTAFACATMARRSRAQADEFAALQVNAGFRATMRLMTLVWGFGLLASAALSIVLVYRLSIRHYLLVSPFLSYGTFCRAASGPSGMGATVAAKPSSKEAPMVAQTDPRGFCQSPFQTCSTANCSM